MSLAKCPDCGAKVSTSAAACPKCGRPAPFPTPRRGVLRTVGLAFLGVTALGLVLAIVNPPDPSSTPEPVAEEPKPPPQPLFDKSPAMQAERKATIDKLIRARGATKLECRPRGATLGITPVFMDAPFEVKEGLLDVVYAYCFDGTEPAIVRLVDGRTNKEIGSYVPGSLRFD